MNRATDAAENLRAPAEPWEYNPSAWSQRLPICVLAGIACLIAVYMGLYQVRLVSGVWDPIFGEQSKTVLDSDVSHTMRRWFVVPDSIMGAIAYLGDLVFGLAGSTRRWQFRPWLVMIFGLDVIPLGIVSAVLVFMQGYTVGAWCFLCLVTAVISLILVYLAYDEIFSCLKYLRLVRRESGNWRTVWDAFIGRPSPAAVRAGRQIAAGK